MMKLRSGEGRRSWTGFVVLIGGAFVVSFFFARTSEPVSLEDATGRSMERAATGGRGTGADAPVEGADVGALEDRAADLQREIDGLEQLARAYEEELYGAPCPWPDDLPAAVTPDGFRAQVRAAVDACGGEVDLVGFDCSEPPCLALLRPQEATWRDTLIHDCPQWHETYGKTTSGASFTVECEDGSEERVEMVGVPASDVLGDDAVGEPGNLMKRLKARASDQELRWSCDGEGA
jgi:hypothetical protein